MLQAGLQLLLGLEERSELCNVLFVIFDGEVELFDFLVVVIDFLAEIGEGLGRVRLCAMKIEDNLRVRRRGQQA